MYCVCVPTTEEKGGRYTRMRRNGGKKERQSISGEKRERERGRHVKEKADREVRKTTCELAVLSMCGGNRMYPDPEREEEKSLPVCVIYLMDLFPVRVFLSRFFPANQYTGSATGG